MKPELFSLDFEALSRRLGGTGRARDVKTRLRQGVDPFVDLTHRARERLTAGAERTVLDPVRQLSSPDGTTKLLLRLADGRALETVLIPSAERTTLCVSTQVGCVRGCVFCRTGTMGLERNLSSAEIVGQLFLAIRLAKQLGVAPPSNVVFMGMGEPLDNADAVEAAILEMTDHRSFAIAPRRLTVSTVGPSPKAISKVANWPASLAWSLHSANDEVRRRLVPTARFSVAALRDAFVEALAKKGRGLFVELTLIDGVNDHEGAAEEVIELFGPLSPKPRINLLPMNPSESDLVGSSSSAVSTFATRLIEAGFFTMVRRARGQSTNSACGQLATQRE
ncbi:MAG: 23S rRNA (adenine(2503)-C(2))-methyltransferase RlmN [Deltaproteobacteria bacterium]|nr:23S rRNA (adenine(2503)-C(2))-methyltransferase RlmN [Deltaproteobacteria bacterium]